jgi:hypothetical protein
MFMRLNGCAGREEGKRQKRRRKIRRKQRSLERVNLMGSKSLE